MLVTIVTTAAMVLVPGASPWHRVPAAAVAGACSGATERTDVARRVHALTCLVNRARAAHGLRRLQQNTALGLAARRHAADMVERTFFAHDSPGGSTPRSRVRRAGYRGARIGETLAFAIGTQATPAGAVRAWLRSPPHRRVLLDRSMRDMGAGFARGVPLKIRGAGLGATVVLDVGGG